MNETSLKRFLKNLYKNLNTLREREAKYGGNTPLELLNEIDDHQTAIALVESRLANQISDEQLKAQLAPLNVPQNLERVGLMAVPVLPLALAGLVILALLGFVAYRVVKPVAPPTATPIAGPTRMSSETLFNVAVAQIGQKDGNGQIQPSADGQQLSRWIVKGLQNEYNNLPANLKDKVQLWNDDLPLTEKSVVIGLIANATEAAAKAETLNADLIIYGHLTRGEKLARFEPQFYMRPLRGEAAEIDEISGLYQLGSPITVTIPLGTDPVAKAGLESRVSLRARAMRWFTTGFIYELSGETVTAYQTFRQAEEDLKAWKEQGEGKEILYYFIGQETLILSRSEADARKFFDSVAQGRESAAAYFHQALASNATYARAYMGLGGVSYQRAQDQKQPEQRLAAPDLEEAIKNFKLALDFAPNLPGDYTAPAARYGLALTAALKGQAYLKLGGYDEAEVYFDWMLRESETILEALRGTHQHRLLAQVYQAQAATYEQLAYLRERQGRAADSAALRQKAKEAYAHCAAQGDPAQDGNPDDQVLRKIIQTYCR